MKSSELDVTTYAALRTGGKRGASFTPGSPDTSLLVKFMTGELKPPMPLGGPPVPAGEVDTLRQWIQAGAKDDSPRETTQTNQPSLYLQPPVITALRFSPDGQYLAVAGNREVLLHKADGTGIVSRLQGKAERILSLAFTPNGELLIAAGGNPATFGEIQVWDVRQAKLLRSIELSNDTVFGASVSGDGKTVAVGCADNMVRMFDLASGKELSKIGGHENWVLGTVFGVNSKRVVSVGRDRAAKLSDAAAGQFLENINQMRGELSAVARHPTKDEIVIGGEDRSPYVYMMDRPRNLKVGEEATLVRTLQTQEGAIFALDWSPDGKLIAVAGAGPAINLYDSETGASVASCKGHSAGVYTVAFAPDSRKLAAGGFDGQVRLYDAKDCALLKAFVPVPISTAVAVSGGVR